MIQIIVGRDASYQHQKGGDSGQHGQQSLAGARLIRQGMLHPQCADLSQDVLLHALGKHQRRQAGIQGANDIIHCSDTILSAEFPGACAPGGVG